MRSLTYFVASTLDGFVAGPDGADPTGPGGFWPIPEDYLHHLVATYPETLPGPARAALGITAEGRHFDAVVEGRGSYQVGLDAGVTDAFPHLQHVVFSTTLGNSPDPAVEVVPTDPVARVRELKSVDGKGIWLIGGGTLAGSLYAEIDRLVIKQAPITIGAGIPLFGAAATFEPTAWQLTDRVNLDSGASFLTFDRTA